MKIIIAGGRDFNNYELLKQKCDFYFSKIIITEIVSGNQVTKKNGQKYGTDYLGERYAKEKGYSIKLFRANWDKYNKAAGPIRNGEMAGYANALIAFWDGKSTGTDDMIKKAKDNNLLVRVVLYTNPS